MNGIFLFLAKELGSGTLNNLLGFTLAHALFPMSFRFSEDEIFFFREFDRRYGLEPITTDGYKEVPPTRLIVVSNFAIITRLLARLSSNAQIVFKSVHQYVHLDRSLSSTGHPKMRAGIIDSHFHLDGFSIQFNIPLHYRNWRAPWKPLYQLTSGMVFKILFSQQGGLRMAGRWRMNQD